MMYRTDHLNNCLSSMYSLDITVDVNNRQFALQEKPEVYYIVMMPTKFSSRREFVSLRDDFRILCWERRQWRTIPTC